MTTSNEQIAREIFKLRRTVEALARKNNLAFSSLEDGAVNEYDENGTLTQIIGKQFDGTHVAASVTGPNPPMPTQPAVTAAIGGLKVKWDGLWFADAITPMDFKNVEVHASQVSDFPADTADTLRTTFVTERGGEVFIPLAEGTWYVRLVAKSLSGKKSDPSVQAAGVPVPIEEVGGTTIHYGTEDPMVTDPSLVPSIGDLWFYETDEGPPPEYETRRWDGDEWALVRDQGIGQALADAFAAQQAADAANTEALAAYTLAGTAQDSADTAQDTAEASFDYTRSRGTDLVANGTAYLGSNFNFSAFTLDQADAPTGAAGSFRPPVGSSVTAYVDEFIPVVPSGKYRLSCHARQQNPAILDARFYMFLAPHDASQALISPSHYMEQASTRTTLAQPLNPGDTVIHLTSAANWKGSAANPAGGNSHQRSIIVWNYTDPFGKKWAPGTYSRLHSGSNAWDDGDVNTTTNTIALNAPWPASLGSHPAGTEVGNGSSGGSFMYLGAGNSIIPQAWTQFSGTASGVHTNLTSPATTAFPAATAFVRIGFLPNRTGAGAAYAGSSLAIGLVSLSDVAAAQADAALALTNAATAQSTANAKITAYYQEAEPVGGNERDLWLRTSDKRLHIYTAGDWVESQDEGIADAIAAAGTAQATADGKVRIFAQTSAPTGLTAGDVGDLWIDLDDGNKMYRWDTQQTIERINRVWNPNFGRDAAYWQASASADDPYRYETVSGTSQLRWESTGATTRVRTTTEAGADVQVSVTGNETVRLRARLAHAGTASRNLQLMAYVLDATDAVLMNAVVDSEAPAGGTFADLSADVVMPAGAAKLSLMLQSNNSVAGDVFAVEYVYAGDPGDYFDGDSPDAVWTGTPYASPSKTWKINTASLGWQPNLLRGNAIEPKSIIAKDVIATGTVTAALLESVLVLASQVIAGDPDGDHTSIDETGVVLYRQNTDGSLQEAGRLGGVGVPYLSFPNAGIDPDGVGSFTRVHSEEDPELAGRPFLGTFADYEVPNETNAAGWLDRLPRGVVASYINTDINISGTGEIGTYELAFFAERGRMYRITLGPVLMSTTSGVTRGFRVRLAKPSAHGGTAPKASLTNAAVWGYAYDYGSGSFTSTGWTGIFRCGWNGTGELEYYNAIYRVLPCLYSSSGTVTASYQFYLLVEDIGIDMPNTGVLNTGGGGTAEPSKTYTKTYSPKWAQAYYGDNTKRGGGSDDLYQGRTPYYTANGVHRSLIAWPDAVVSDLSGATVNKVEVYLYNKHWHSAAGGTASFGYHGHTGGAAPTTFSATSIGSHLSSGWPRSAGRWVTLPSSWYAGIKSGSIRGVVLCPPSYSTSDLYYGYFAGGTSPKFRITYTK